MAAEATGWSAVEPYDGNREAQNRYKCRDRPDLQGGQSGASPWLVGSVPLVPQLNWAFLSAWCQFPWKRAKQQSRQAPPKRPSPSQQSTGYRKIRIRLMGWHPHRARSVCCKAKGTHCLSLRGYGLPVCLGQTTRATTTITILRCLESSSNRLLEHQSCLIRHARSVLGR